MKVLLTGGGGFMGHHAISYLLNNTDWEIVVTDSFRHGGISSRIRDILNTIDNKRLKIIAHDLSTPIDNITAKQFGDINVIINAASLANVDDSIKDPVPFIQNNINIGINVFEYARKLDNLKTIIHVSTDEVFGDVKAGSQHFEFDQISPSNPYSASKVGQEAIAQAYWRTYELPVVITNATNMFGERQSGKAFIPKAISGVINNKIILIHSKTINGELKTSSRFYLYVNNQVDAIKFLVEKFSNEGHRFSDGLDNIHRFNVSGDQEFYNDQIVKSIADLLNINNIKLEYVSPESARPGLDLRYSLNHDKIKSIGWQQPFSFDTALEKTVSWYYNNQNWLDI